MSINFAMLIILIEKIFSKNEQFFVCLKVAEYTENSRRNRENMTCNLALFVSVSSFLSVLSFD